MIPAELHDRVEFSGGRIIERRPWVDGSGNDELRDYYASRIKEARTRREKSSKSKPNHASERARLDAAEREGDEAFAAYEERARLARESRAREKLRDRHFRILSEIISDEAAWQWVKRVSLHEAGHCVSYYFDCAGVDAVGLELEENPARCSGYARCKDTEMRSAQSILAGIAAERVAGYDARALSTDKDVTKARRELPVGRRSDADVEREIGQASDTLRKYWPAVTALAREIRLKVDVGGAEAEAIIARALGASRVA